MRAWLIVPVSRDYLLLPMKDLKLAHQKDGPTVNATVDFDGDELHRTMTCGPKRWLVIRNSTAGATARVSIRCFTSAAA